MKVRNSLLVAASSGDNEFRPAGLLVSCSLAVCAVDRARVRDTMGVPVSRALEARQKELQTLGIYWTFVSPSLRVGRSLFVPVHERKREGALWVGTGKQGWGWGQELAPGG